MYPQRELSKLAVHRAVLCRRLALERTQCAGALTRIMQPLACLDRMLILWRRLSPLLRHVPLALLVRRAARPRWNLLGSLVAWSPLVFDVVRAWRLAPRPSVRDWRPSGLPSRSPR